MSKGLTIEFGAMAPSLVRQLEGLLPKSELKRFELIAQAITTCSVNGLISEGTTEQARQRLIKMIEKAQLAALQPTRKE